MPNVPLLALNIMQKLKKKTQKRKRQKLDEVDADDVSLFMQIKSENPFDEKLCGTNKNALQTC